MGWYKLKSLSGNQVAGLVETQSDNIYSTIKLDSLSSYVLNALNAHIGILDADGKVVAFNKQWKSFTEKAEMDWYRPGLNANYLECLQEPLTKGNDYALKLLIGIKSVLSGEKSSFQINYPLITNGSKHWFKATINALEGTQGAVFIHEDVSHHIQSRQYIRETQQKFEQFFENTLYGIVVADDNNAIIEINKTASSILQSPADELIFEDVTKFITMTTDVNEVQKLIKRDGNYIGEHVVTTAEGNKIPVEMHVGLFRNDKGVPVTSWIFKDITEQKKSEAALKINEKHLEKVVQENNKNGELLNQLFINSPVGIVLIGNDGLIQDSNNSFEHIFGYNISEIKDKKLDDVIVPPNMKEHAQSMSEQSFTGDSFQSEAVRLHKDGSEIPVLVGGIPVEIDGEIIAIYGMYVDISERTRLENQVLELLKQEKIARVHVEEMFNETPSAIAMLEGKNHTFTFANDKYRELIGVSDPIDKSIKDVLPEIVEQGFLKFLDKCYKYGRAYFFNEQEVFLENRPHPLYLNFVFKPILVDQKDTCGIFIHVVDVTEQVEARKIIEKSLAEKETLLSEVHHRVKNNLAIISGLIELEMMVPENELVSKHLESTHSRVSTIAKIHEMLYQSENLSQVSFTTYIKNAIDKDYSLFNNDVIHLIAKKTTREIILNVNQAIPFGMLLNEIFSSLANLSSNGTSSDFEFELTEKQSCVTITFVDLQKQLLHQFEKERDASSLRNNLINVLSTQIDATLETSLHEQHVLTISFHKKEVKGPYNSLN